MPNLRNIFYSLFAVILVAGGVWFAGGYHLPQPQTSTSPPALVKETPAYAPTKVRATDPQPQTVQSDLTYGITTPPPAIKEQEEEHAITVVLKAGEHSYTVSIPNGANVYDAMATLSKQSSFTQQLSGSEEHEGTATAGFTFSATSYAELGYLVDAINGIKNANGYYWTLYMNGKYSEIGASSVHLKTGDTVEWKYTNKPFE